MTMCAISTKKCTYVGGGDVTHVYLQNKYGREDFQKITAVELKKTKIKKYKNVDNCSHVLSFNRFIILLKPSPFPFLIIWRASLPNWDHTYSFYGQNNKLLDL